MTKFRANLSAWSGYQKNGKNSNGQLVIEDSGDILVKNIWRSDALGNVNDLVDRRLDGKKVFLRNRFGDEIILNMNRDDAETFYRLISVDQLAISAGASQMNISPEEKSRIDEGEGTLLEPQDKVKREKPQEETKKAQARENRSDSAHRLEPPPTPACPSCGVVLETAPQRKKKCPSCGEYIYVRTRPSDRQRVLVTEAGVKAIQREWEADHFISKWISSLERWAITRTEYELGKDRLSKRFGQEASDRDAIWFIFGELCRKKALDWQSLHELYHSMAVFQNESRRDCFKLLQISAKMSLYANRQSLAKFGITFKLRVRTGGEQSCIACRLLEGKEFTLEEALEQMPIPVRECTHTLYDEKRGFCRCWYAVEIG